MQVPSWSKYILKYNNFKDAWMPEIRKRKLQTIYPSYFACFVSHTIKVSTTWDIGVVQYDGGSAACGSVMLKIQQIPAWYALALAHKQPPRPHTKVQRATKHTIILPRCMRLPAIPTEKPHQDNPLAGIRSLYYSTYTHKLTPNAHTLRSIQYHRQGNTHSHLSAQPSQTTIIVVIIIVSIHIWTYIQSQANHPRFLQNNMNTKQRRHVLATLPMSATHPAPLYTKPYAHPSLPFVCVKRVAGDKAYLYSSMKRALLADKKLG